MKKVLIAFLLFLASPSLASNWLVVEIGIIGTSSEDILNSSLDLAYKKQYDGLVVQLDTPGGALDNTREMVKTIMAAKIPVIVWVGPAGSRAGSAGAFITLSGHVAAMAPGTNIGAAHPIQASGKDIEQEEVQRKVMNDTVAFIESVAKSRNRNVEMARSFVITSVSITDEEALKNNIIDLVARDLGMLLDKSHGKEIELQDGKKVTLDSKDATTIIFEKSFRQKILEILSNPNLFYLLFMAGLIGLGYELTHPGAIFPGVVGGICFILAMIATSVLPVSYGAAALIFAGVIMLIAEAFVPSFGILGFGGFIAFILGSVFLVDPENQQGLRISWYTIAPSALVISALFITLGYLVLKAEKAPVHSGREAMIGEKGTVVSEFVNGRGQIRVAGALWSAQITSSEQPLKPGDQVEVDSLDGLTLLVKATS